MILKRSTEPNAFERCLVVIWRYLHRNKKVLAGSLVGLSALTLIVALQIAPLKKWVTKSAGIKNYFIGFTANPEHLSLDIKHKHFQKLGFQRKEGLRIGQLTPEMKESVPAQFRYQGRYYPAEVRLKGQWDDHIRSTKWSLKVKLKKGGFLFGMRRFSLQHPQTRNYVHEWFYQAALKREGLLALRYKFVSMSVNGKPMGIYALEEGLDKQLIESNARREGIIVSYDASNYYNPVSHIKGYVPFVDTGVGDESNATLRPQPAKRVLRSPALKAQFLLAKAQFEAFRNHKKQTSEVFDVDKMARFLALSERLGAIGSAADWKDIKLYYNPVTSLFEPVGYEGEPTWIHSILGAGKQIANSKSNHFFDRLFSDARFFQKYLHYLNTYSEEKYFEGLLADLSPSLNENLKIIYSEWPFQTFNKSMFEKNAFLIRAYLNPNKAIRTYITEMPTKLKLSIVNTQRLPVRLKRITLGNKSLHRFKNNTLLSPNGFQSGAFHEVVINKPTHWNTDPSLSIQAHYNVLGIGREKINVALNWPFENTARLPAQLSGKFSSPSNSLLNVDDDRKQIRFATDRTTINKTLIIPSGYRLIVPAGQIIALGQGASLISYSPVDLLGTAKKPITIRSLGNARSGFAVIDAQSQSNVRHTRFVGLSNPSQGEWQLTGAVSFYESPVHISHTLFSKNNSEDALNLVRSPFKIVGSTFEKTFSDAFDSDFSDGQLLASSFQELGNDGVDISGSKMQMEEVVVTKAGDKAISIGEQSSLQGARIQVQESNMGIVSKDNSTIRLKEVSVKDSRMGVVAYQKKPEFGPAQIQIEGLQLHNIETPTLIEKGSRAYIDGKLIDGSLIGLYEKLYTASASKSVP